MDVYNESTTDRQPDPVILEARPDELGAARARLIEQIRRKPEPIGESLARAEERWRRRSRLADARRVLRAVQSNTRLAVALDVTPRTVCYWRAGKHSPSVPHWRQLRALGGLLSDVGVRVDSGVQIIDQDAAD